MAEEKKKTRSVQPRINVAVDKPVFSWQSPEFVRYRRDRIWLTYVLIVALILLIVLILMHQWSGVALVAVASLVFITLSGVHPKEISVALYAEGVIIDKKVYDFSQLKSFWISYGDLPKIKLQSTGRFAGEVVMPLGSEDPEQIRLFLSKHLPEEADRGEDLTDMINRILRF